MPVNEGIYPAVFTTDVGKVRLLTSDTDATENPASGGDPATWSYIWASDLEIEAHLELTGSAERAALRILRLVAMTPAMQYKKWSSADLSVDGAAITRALRELINDIEKSLNGDATEAAAEYMNMVDTGTAMGQPAFYRDLRYAGAPIDSTLPFV